jgi:hypothetical protein
MANSARLLSAISFYAPDTTYNQFSGTFTGVRIYASHTSRTSLSSTFADNYNGNTPVLVYSNSSLFLNIPENAWGQINFDSIFAYNGSDNLLIEIQWDASPSGGLITSTTSGSALQGASVGAVTGSSNARAVLRMHYVPPPSNQISGYVLDADGIGVVGATIQGLYGNPVTDANGLYSAMVWDGWSGTVAPQATGHIIIPSTRGYASVTGNHTQQNYSALSTVGIDEVPTTVTYTTGPIPTDYNFQSLPGASSSPASITVSIPPDVIIIGVDVSYTMTAISDGWMSEQRSWLRCTSPGGAGEAQITQGVGGSEGTYSYSRTGLTIANEVKGGGDITFELHAGRTWGGSGANADFNRVDNGSLQVTVHHIEMSTRPCFDDLDMTIGSTPSMLIKPGLPDHFYTLQYNRDLTNPNGWQNVPGQTKVPGYGEPLEMTGASASQTSTYYRVLMETTP